MNPKVVSILLALLGIAGSPDKSLVKLSEKIRNSNLTIVEALETKISEVDDLDLESTRLLNLIHSIKRIKILNEVTGLRSLLGQSEHHRAKRSISQCMPFLNCLKKPSKRVESDRRFSSTARPANSVVQLGADVTTVPPASVQRVTTNLEEDLKKPVTKVVSGDGDNNGFNYYREAGMYYYTSNGSPGSGNFHEILSFFVPQFKNGLFTTAQQWFYDCDSNRATEKFETFECGMVKKTNRNYMKPFVYSTSDGYRDFNKVSGYGFDINPNGDHVKLLNISLIESYKIFSFDRALIGSSVRSLENGWNLITCFNDQGVLAMGLLRANRLCYKVGFESNEDLRNQRPDMEVLEHGLGTLLRTNQQVIDATRKLSNKYSVLRRVTSMERDKSRYDRLGITTI